MSSGKVVLGVLAGVAVGATLGILLAPDKGSNTRRKIAQKSDDYIDALEDKFNMLMDGMSKKYDSVSDSVGQLAKDTRYKAEEITA